MKISASFLSIKDNLKENILKLDKINIDYLHLDIMDGSFVNNKTWDIFEIKNLVKNIQKPLDIHLMVSDIFKYIDDYKSLNPYFITFHYEATSNPDEVIEYLKKLNIKIGMSIKPNTKIDKIIKYLPKLDLVLVMSVEPGMGGQDFVDNSINKINRLHQIREEYNLKYVIEVDGGINDITIKDCFNADIAVVGSFITNSDDYQKQIDLLKK